MKPHWRVWLEWRLSLDGLNFIHFVSILYVRSIDKKKAMQLSSHESFDGDSFNIYPQADSVDILFDMVKPGEMDFINDDQVLMDNIIEHDQKSIAINEV